MHEAGIIESMLAIAGRKARGNGSARINMIRLRVGSLRGVEPEALQHAFSILCKETVESKEARLEVEQVAAVFHCSGCNREFETESMFGECPDCGVLSAEIRRGMELEIVLLEVD